jgi:SAM-dependent methyltransferase
MNETLGNTDQIYGAYKGTLGEDLMLSTRERFTWQSSMVKGNKVLDIGCSQGILPILLAREGKEVYGMDIMEDAIKFAHDLKSQEHLKVQERITFVNEDYNQSEIDKVFDTVILGEIIEHLFYPQNLIKKVLKNLSSGGRVVITVPFGINDYYDHRKTYYLYDLLELLKNDFDIVEIHYSDIRESTNWIGIVADKRRYSQKNADVIPFPWLEELEKHFYKREKLLTRQINEQKEENQKLKL